MRILGLEQLDSQRARQLEPDARRCAHFGEQRLGNLQAANPLAFRFDVHGTRRLECLECGNQPALEGLLRWLRIDGEIAEQRSAMPCEALEVERLSALGGQ